MKKALISTTELILTGYRVAQVEDETNIFDVAEGMYWADCNDYIIADKFYFDVVTNSILPFPKQSKPNQPTTTGTQTL